MVTNIAMFAPLTFCALGAWTCRNQRRARWWVVVAIFLAGVILSFVVEFSQVFVTSRTPSRHDIVAQTIGNGLGLAMWFVFGIPLTQWVVALMRQSDRSTLHMRLLYTYAALLCLYSLLPLNLTISVGQIWRKYKAGMVNFVPFGNPSELYVLAIAMKTLLYVPIGYMSACRAGRGRRPLLMAMVGGAMFAAGIESLQIFVASRIATVTDILLGALGALAGGLVASFTGPVAAGKGIHSVWWQRWGMCFKLLATAACLGLIVYQRWGTIAVALSSVTAVEGLDATTLALPGSMVYSAGPLDALPRLAQEFGVWLTLGLLIQALASSSNLRRLVATSTCILLALTLELIRLQFSPYRFDMLLTFAAIAGAAASYWVYPRLITIFLTPADPSQRSESVRSILSTPESDLAGLSAMDATNPSPGSHGP